MPNASSRLETLLSVALTTAAVVIAAVVVYREFAPSAAARGVPAGRPELISQWDSAWANSIVVGDAQAPVRILQFVDLECPFCRRFHKLAREFAARHGSRVAIGFLHYPIESHRFAGPAAQALECAGEQGRFMEFADVVLQKQDSLGLKSWVSFAAEAGVADVDELSNCAGRQGQSSRISRHKAVGESLGVRATPTVIINGWRYPTPPDSVELERIVADVSPRKGPLD